MWTRWARKQTPVEEKAPQLPPGLRVYAIGDVHGRSDLLEETLQRIDEDMRRRPTDAAVEVYLGDYVDRGPASKEVVDLLVDRRREHNVIGLMGNHERLLLDFIERPETFPLWQQCGGSATLLSYGVTAGPARGADRAGRLAVDLRKRLPKAHRRFFEDLRPYYIAGDFFFVHAGVQPHVPLEEQSEYDLLWIRGDFLTHRAPFEKYIVHGHTPVERPERRSNRINIDTGAYATGRLTCLRLEGSDMEFL